MASLGACSSHGASGEGETEGGYCKNRCECFHNMYVYVFLVRVNKHILP